MAKNYLIDTNVLSDGLKGKLSTPAISAIKVWELNISVMTQIELLCWDTEKESQVIDLIGICKIYGVTNDIILRCAAIRKKHKVKLVDAIIAATAIENKFSLLTSNVKDFKKIDGLTVISPHDL